MTPRQEQWQQPLGGGRALLKRPKRLPAVEYRGAARLAAVAILAAVASPVAAAPPEGVSIPYRCSVERGQVRLQRGPQRVYRIVGSRDLQTVTICNGPRSDSCRTIPIHRFALDCGGTTIPWVQASGAMASGQPWRTSVAAGRMTLHLVRNSQSYNRTTSVILPPGFAPTPLSSVRFVPLEQPSTTPADRPRSPPRPVVSETAMRAPATPAATPDTAKPATLPKRPGTALPRLSLLDTTLVAASEVQSASAHIDSDWNATVNTIEDNRATQNWTLAPAGGSSGLMAGLAIAALLLSATAVATRQRLSARQASFAAPPESVDAAEMPITPPPLPIATTPEAEMAPQSTTETPPPLASTRLDASEKADEAQSPPPPPPPARVSMSSPPHSAAPIPTAPSPTSVTWSEIVDLRTTALALLDLDRHIVADLVPEGALRDVLLTDLASIAARLESPELADALAAGRFDLAQPIYAQAIIDLERARTLARIEHERALEASTGPDRSLATIEEACAFLGVNPRASEAVVKKVVDALRQNWHPDLASDDDDRHAREARIKLINAAWDLIRGR